MRENGRKGESGLRGGDVSFRTRGEESSCCPGRDNYWWSKRRIKKSKKEKSVKEAEYVLGGRATKK